MKFHSFKPYAKYGLFLILIISLVGTVNAATNHTGGIALSWDDTANTDKCYQYLSIFQKYNAKCTMNVNIIYHSRIPKETLVDDLNALHSDGWEISGHGYNHTDSVIFLRNNTPEELLNQEIFPNIVDITSYDFPVYTFAYPYSHRNDTTDATISPYFRTLRTGAPIIINGNVNETPLAYYKWDDAQILYGVEIDDQSGVSLESIKYGIDHAIDNGYVLVLYGHTITENVTVDYQTSTARLDEILNYTCQKGGVFYTMGELGNSAWVRPPRFSNVNANFAISSDNVLVGETVTFVDYSVNHTSELLDFGDGSDSTTANVNHIYTAPGTYTANLTVKNDVSDDSMTKTITVSQPITPVASFTSNCTTGNAPLTVQFTDTSTGSPTSWNWDFGDGDSSTEQNPEHTFITEGVYTVNLTASNGVGSSAVKSMVITVNRVLTPPVANFTANTTEGYAPLTVQLTDTSSNSPTEWNWNFGDGTSSTEQNPTHSYSLAGNYNVNLTVSNADGTDSKTAVITVLEEEEDENDGLPVANFSTNVTSGYAPLSVLFTDLSENATSRSWDVNNDGIEDSTEASFVYTYTSTGTYTAKLTASNANGPATKTILIYVDKKSSSKSSSSGGGGGSPESSRNIEVKELSQVFISNGKAVKFDFTKAATCVVSVGFDAKKTAGKITTIAEQLKGKSSLVSQLPSDEVYKSFNLWVGNGGYATEKNIENPVICFKVEKTWIQDQNIDQSSIILNRYNDKKWNPLPTRISGEDGKYLYFTAETPGFSPFAITGKITAKETVNEILPEPDTQDPEQNENTKSEVEQDSEQKEKTGIPGFEMIYCIIGLLGVFLHRRR